MDSIMKSIFQRIANLNEVTIEPIEVMTPD